METVDRSARRGRAVRGAAAAAVATTVASTAHTLAGGAAPPVWLLIAVTLLAMPVAVALTGRRPSLWRTSVVVALSQVLLHVAFATVGSALPAASRHVHGAPPTLSVGVDAAALTVDPVMIGGHVLAAIVTVVLLTRGERAMRAIAAGLRQVVSRATVALPAASPVSLPMAPVGHRPAPLVALASLSRRGPPLHAH